MMPDNQQEPDDEFERFEDLTRELLKVPKSELDAKRKEERQDGHPA